MVYEINFILSLSLIIVNTFVLHYLSKRFNFKDNSIKTAFIVSVLMQISSNILSFGLIFLGITGIIIAFVLILISHVLVLKYFYHLDWNNTIKTYFILIIVTAIISVIVGGIAGAIIYTLLIN